MVLETVFLINPIITCILIEIEISKISEIYPSKFRQKVGNKTIISYWKLNVPLLT